MAFPQIRDADTTTFIQSAANATAWTPTWPSNNVLGDLNLGIISSDGDVTFTWPGFTLIRRLASSAAATLAVYARTVQGGESGTMTVTVSVAERGVIKMHRIQQRTGDPEASTGTSGTSTAPDPDSLSPSWGSDDTLWMALVAGDDQNVGIVYPTDFTDGTYDDAGGSNGSYLLTCRRLQSAASQDPGAFSQTNSTEWAAVTVGIRGVPDVGMAWVVA